VLGPASSHPREPVHTSLVGLRLERSIDECLRRDVAPLPTPEDRGGYHGQRHFDFWLSGLADHLRIIDAAARVGVTLAAGDRVLDFGCGSGRVLRHFLAQRPELEAWGVDANPAAVEWIASNLSPAAKVFRTTTFPHLPLPDASFKVAFALAVFSHLDELDIAQLLELRRCLVPGGIAYVSVQTDATWARLDESNPAFRLVQAARDAHPDLDLSPEALRAGMPGERLVFPGPAGHAPCVFRSERFIRETWGRFFEVCEIISRGCAAEDVVVLRRPLEGVAAAATPAPSKAVPVAAVPVDARADARGRAFGDRGEGGDRHAQTGGLPPRAEGRLALPGEQLLQRVQRRRVPRRQPRSVAQAGRARGRRLEHRGATRGGCGDRRSRR
jgi:SAM-dependent methyltransferase